jgi:hypothetical protein
MKLRTIFKCRRILLWVLLTKLKGVNVGKKVKRVKSRGPSRKAPQKGDVYVITNDVAVADVDGDGVSDLIAKHNVTKNGEAFVSSEVVWYGLDEETVAVFLAAMDEEGLTDDEPVKTDKFNVVAKSWKSLTKFLKKINDLADVKAVELD